MITPTKITVRFSDVDMMGHVNNAVYLNYFETARMDFFTQILGQDWDWEKNGIILLKNEVEYKQPLLLKDEPVVAVDVQDIGNKSFTLRYSLKVDGLEYSCGISVLVAFDYHNRKAQEIPKEMREQLLAVKGNNY